MTTFASLERVEGCAPAISITRFEHATVTAMENAMPNKPRDNVCVFITDAGEIAEHMFGCPKSITLADAALYLQQNLNAWDKDEEGWSWGRDEEGWPDLWSCEPSEPENANVTVVMVQEDRFREGMAAHEAMSAACRNLGRVNLAIVYQHEGQ